MAAGFNPFSATNEERQNFPKFSPIFKSSTPVSEKGKPFRWSIDQLARLKPTHIDTNDSALALVAKHSPDNDAAKQSELDAYFMQATLPSPWPASNLTKKTASSKPHKHVSFVPPTANTFISEEDLVESGVRDGQTADAGTQTTLTFPSNFDLEKLLAAMSCEAPPTNDLDDSCEWTNDMEDETSLGNSLRRKLFGQPERESSTPPLSPKFRAGSMDMTSSPILAPGHSSMIMSPGRMTPALSPIGEGVEPTEYSIRNSSPDVHMSVVVYPPSDDLPIAPPTVGDTYNTPHRHALPYNSTSSTLSKRPTSRPSTSPVLSEDLLRRKEALKRCLQKSPVKPRSPGSVQVTAGSPQYLSTTLEKLARSSPGGFFPPSSPSVGLYSPLGFYNKPSHSPSPPVMGKGEPFMKSSWQSLYPSDLSHSLLSPSHKRMKVRLKELHHY